MNTFLIQKFPNRISLSQAAQITGYHQDYLGRLCRNGKLRANKIGRNWYTTKTELEQLFVNGDLIEEIETVSEPEQEEFIAERHKPTDSAYLQSRPVVAKNIVVSEVQDIPISIAVKSRSQQSAAPLATLIARMRLDALQKDVLEMSGLVENLASEVQEHSRILAKHEAMLQNRPDLRSTYMGTIEAGQSAKSQPELVLLEDETEDPISSQNPWILRTTSWVTIGVVAVLAVASVFWSLYKSGNLNTNLSSVTTTFYSQDAPEPAVAGDSITIPQPSQNTNIISE